MVKKIINIIKGNVRRLIKYDTPLSKRRKSICYSCKSMKHIFIIGNICKNCGCPIKSKTLVEEEQCPEGKW